MKMKRVIGIIAICFVGLIVYVCRPGYVVFMDYVCYNHISEGVGFRRIQMDADARTFKVDKEYSAYGIDKNRAYYFGKPILESDGESFKILDGSYQKDKNHVYYKNNIIPSADPQTFIDAPWDSTGHEPLCFAKDKNDFYYCGNPIGVSNRKSFKQWYVNGYLWGVDSCYCYFRNQKCRIKGYDKFKVLSSGLYAKDDEHVFYLGNIVEGADPQSFYETEIFRGKDKNGDYNQGKVVVTFHK